MTLQEFIDKYLGKQVEYHSYGSGAYNQCVDLVNAYINECLDNNTKDYTEIIGTDAKDFKTKFDPEDFDFIANTTTPNVVPERGDVGVMNGRVGGGVGHVFIVTEADGMVIKSFDQNWSEVERTTLEEHSYTNVSGWLRPKRTAEDCSECKKDLADCKHKLESKSAEIARLEQALETLGKNFDVLNTQYQNCAGSGRLKDKEIEDLKKEVERLQNQKFELSEIINFFLTWLRTGGDNIDGLS